ncbi:MAG: Asp-tRNA(Asn)/Glu-tRNA(Gln) amidotransferase subunit GatB [Anaerolineales bacterium]|nr:Asp-tRNA(Asn)/Glu-tRNA(Gln) amidotransferase subunit GatB [Anaerolineales bacterium]
MEWEPVVGLEVHAELRTRSKMFCGCAVVDSTTAEPNTVICPVCLGMPGSLPVINRRAVDMGMRVAAALECRIEPVSVFARKNYFYPDLPKGYQISQYEMPLAVGGKLRIWAGERRRTVRIRRVHLEEDTGKLIHEEKPARSLVDLNRAGVPLLEIVSEPDLHSIEEVKAYATALRRLLRYLEVNNGDMEKGVIRFEANISLRPAGSEELGTRVEVKNLNSFRAMIRAMEYEIGRQSALRNKGGQVEQETLGWNETTGRTYSQRSKEEAHDYRYFPEPDLPPLEVSEAWRSEIADSLPELPDARCERLMAQYGLKRRDAEVIVEDKAAADFYEKAVSESGAPAKHVAAWLSGDLFGLLNARNLPLVGEDGAPTVSAEAFGKLIRMVTGGTINGPTGKKLLAEMVASGKSAEELVDQRGLRQIGDEDTLREEVRKVLAENPGQVESYRKGKSTVIQWLLGQVMKATGGRANPKTVRGLLEKELTESKDSGK